MNIKKKNTFRYFLINFLIFFILMLFHFSGNISLKIALAEPIPYISLLIAVSMFSSETAAAFSGLVLGFFADSVSAQSSVFNTVCLFLIALAVSVLMHFTFNNNIFSALALGVSGNIFYFLLNWLFFHCFNSGSENISYYLFRIGIPSAIYTAVFIVPFYYFERMLYKKYLTN